MADHELLHLPDAAGNKLTVLKYQDRLWPNFDLEAIRGVETMKVREGDVFVMSYPKSGTHWVWEMARLLMAGTTEVPLIEKDVAMIEDVGHEKLEALESPRALNTHSHFELMPREIVEHPNKCKIIYMTRDPRDVAVSYFNHHNKLVKYYNYKGQWKDYFPLFMSGSLDYESWFRYTQGWEQGIKDHPELDVHVTSYESLHENTKEEVERLANFLGSSTDAEFIDQVISKTSFDSMKAVRGNNALLGPNGEQVMYRKGKVGDWKNWFTVAQSEQFNTVFEREMAGTQAYQLYSHTKHRFTTTDGNLNER